MLSVVAQVVQTVAIYYVPECDWNSILYEICNGYQLCAYYWWYGAGCG